MKKLARLLSFRLLIHIFLLRPILKLFFGVNIAGRKNLKALDRYIIIANHNSHLDIFLLFSILPIRHILMTHPVAAEEYFSKQKVVFKLANYLFRPIWIVRDKKMSDPLKGMKEILNLGHNIIMFPEGTRGVPGQIGKFKTGVGRLAEEYRDIPIIPVFLCGPEKAFPKKSAFPLPIWNNITIGPPQIFRIGSLDITASLEKMIHELSESETANRHRRRKRSKPSFSLAVLGIDGSGKSTISKLVSRKLSETLRVCLISDKLEFYENESQKELQPLLTEKVREAVGRYAKTAKSLKKYKIPKMAELLLRDHIMGEVQRWYSPDVIVLDGCPLINLTAWAKLYKGEYFDMDTCSSAMRILSGRTEITKKDEPLLEKIPELAALKRFKLTHMKLPDALIMLDVDPGISITRIQSRGERKQVHETEEKLAKLREGYLMVCNSVKKEFEIPTCVLDGESGIDKVTASALEFIEDVSERRSNDGQQED